MDDDSRNRNTGGLVRFSLHKVQKPPEVDFLVCLFYATPKKHCYVAYIFLGLIYNSQKKYCGVILIPPQESIFSTESLHYLFFVSIRA